MESKQAKSVQQFKKLDQIGFGTYGIVFRARDLTTGQIYALKQVKMHVSDQQQDGFPITSLREISLLRQLVHPNIVKLVDVVVGKKQDSVFLCFEYCRIDLANLVEMLTAQTLGADKPFFANERMDYFNLGEIKCVMLQLVKAVAHLHNN